MSLQLQSQPLVSVIIPTYNRVHLIGESIESVLKQTYTNWELIIVDDGSSDDTESIVARYNNSKIRYIRFPHFGILGKVRNCGIKIAKGEFIAFLDSDDLWREDKLDFQLKLFQAHDIDYTFSNGTHFGEATIHQPPDVENLAVGDLFISLIVEHRFVIYLPSLLFRKRILDKTGMINESFESGGDIDFVYRMARVSKGAFTNERLVSIRKHTHGMSSQHEQTAHLEDLKIYKAFFDEGALSKKQFIQLAGTAYYKLGLINLSRANPREARFFFLKYNVLIPLNYKGWLRQLEAGLGMFFKRRKK
jgi:glycosyltransferase involved in cell wall biosynthesis